MMQTVLVRGSDEVASAVSHHLFSAGLPVFVHDEPYPVTYRRTQAFSDAAFDGKASLAGVMAVRADDLGSVPALLLAHEVVPFVVQPLAAVLDALAPAVLIDARMRKHHQPEIQLGLAPLTIGLGPNFVAGEITDLIVETGWGDDLGQVSGHGATRPLEGDPHPIDGHSRDRFIYACAAGVFRTLYAVGDLVREGQEIAQIDETAIYAPLTGKLRGLTHDGVPVPRGTKVIEVDPRGADADLPVHIGTLPARIAQGILAALQGQYPVPSRPTGRLCQDSAGELRA